MQGITVIDGRADGGDEGPFYVYRRLEDGAIGISRSPKEGVPGFEQLADLPRRKQAEAYMFVAAFGFPIDEGATYWAVHEEFESGNARNRLFSRRTRIAGALVESELRELVERGPYTGAAVNMRGDITLVGSEDREGMTVVMMRLFRKASV
ncbi:hypothetical protein [Streptomyces albogriseolus]|uniref:hypothetical protein n=1 Tax=Streptomyces albogriseolus TaxID=1887 RepID=UPI00345F2C92